MEIIYSYLGYPNFKGLIEIERIAAVSNFFVQRSGFNTRLFCSQEYLHLFERIDFTNIEIIPRHKINLLPKYMPRLSNLIALSIAERPSIHIDMDIIFSMGVPSYINSGIIYMNKEFSYEEDLNFLYDLFKRKTPNSARKILESTTCNTSIFGGLNLKIIQEQCNVILNYLFNNKKFYEDAIEKNQDAIKIDPSLVIDQIWLPQHFKFFNQKIDFLINNKNMYEFIQSSKNLGIKQFRNSLNINEFINYINYFIKLYNINY